MANPNACGAPPAWYILNGGAKKCDPTFVCNQNQRTCESSMRVCIDDVWVCNASMVL